ncbi:unnamed protein product, partial [Linum tenue]
EDYGITIDNVIHLVLKLSDLLLITVRTTCGQEIEFRVNRYRNVRYLKHHIFQEGKGFPRQRARDLLQWLKAQ